jgi:broad specificity phosphatase PhoE
MSPQVRLYFIRHAQSEINAADINIGGQSISCVLSPLGNEQAVLLGIVVIISFFLSYVYCII